MILDLGLLARALIARVLQLEAENAQLRAALAERENDRPEQPAD